MCHNRLQRSPLAGRAFSARKGKTFAASAAAAVVLGLVVFRATFAGAAVSIETDNYEGRPHYRVQTASVTYWLDRKSGGLSRLVDLDGRDWISFRREPLAMFPASAAAGYRGIPNAVFGETNADAGAGHPGFDQCETDLIASNCIRTISHSGQWAWTWTFNDAAAWIRFERVSATFPYWFLYEGVPGGRYSPHSLYWGNDVDGLRNDQPTIQSQAFGRWRWAWFGDDDAPHVLAVGQLQADELDDTFWMLGNANDGAADSPDGMCVFGFGRSVGTRALLRGRRGFVVALVETSREKSAENVRDSLQDLLSPVQVTDSLIHGDMECLRIATPTATYLFGKRGAGFASIIDPAGNDWISYAHGGKSQGEYRGLPKCGQPVKYFHCGYGFGQYLTDQPFETSWTRISPEQIRIHSETADGAAACEWNIHADHASLTLLKIPGKYWFLYEGTPGGRLDAADDFVIRPGGKKTTLSEPWIDDIPWMLFGAKESPFGLLLVAHQAAAPASYVSWPYRPEADGALDQMTVAGFGRPAWDDPLQHTPPLDSLPARFTISMTADVTAEAAAALAARIRSQ